MKLFNSLTKEKEQFVPQQEGKVSMYHCGPTVYDYVHIGNLRTFLMGDFLRRTLEFLGYDVLQVMNITDVGHLVSDGDTGDDKMTKALKREGKDITLENMLEVAGFYADAFERDLALIHILPPHHLPRASEHIAEDLDIITRLEEKGYTYTTSDGVYFDTSKMKDYGKLGGIQADDQNESRVEGNLEKRNPADFALWKFDTHTGWESPWGQGFPGWHIECSGMSMKYLGSQFDIHTGGSDLRSIHHNNEIAQSECATGDVPFAKYWLHGEMLNFGGAKLSKSTGGNITFQVVKDEGYSPVAYRYLCLQTHYRSPMNFTWEALDAAETGVKRLLKNIVALRASGEPVLLAESEYMNQFTLYLEDDLNLPRALSLVHEILKSDLSDPEKLGLLYAFDTVLGLGFQDYEETLLEVPSEVQSLLLQRQDARNEKNWERADQLRDEIASHGYQVRDVDGKQVLEQK